MPHKNDLFSFTDDLEKPYLCKELPVRFLKHKRVFPLRLEGKLMTLVAEDPENIETLDAIQLATHLELKVIKGHGDEILKAIDRYYDSSDTTVDDIVEDISPENDLSFSKEGEDVDHLRDMASEAPIIRLVNLVTARAIERGASDIHLEPFEEALRIRYRIDDILQEVETLPKHLHAAVTSRIKIMANLNIAERRLPQDGRIKMRLSGREIDFRVSTIPTSYGESVVLRVLDRSKLILSLNELGFSQKNQEDYEKMMARPYGMILVTGPTGSGKTTTLYTTLEKINSPKKKILTIEDPVEYQLYGVNQIQVKPQIGLTFANGLRHIVRQDPNIIMVGEIRDRETAEIAVHSALTGHLVFSTLHTNDASGAIARLLEMGVENYLLVSSLIGVVAQRLVRVICSRCKEPSFLEGGNAKKLSEFVTGGKEITAFKGRGCDACGLTGYRGRSGIFEILPIRSGIKSLILQNPEAGVIRTKAIELGMETLRESGLQKMAKGTTTFDEVIRVTQEEEF